MVNPKSLEGVALDLARALSPVGMAFYEGSPMAERKRDRTLVSAADREIEIAARAFLTAATPDFGFLGEETGKTRRLGDHAPVARPRVPSQSGFAPTGALLAHEFDLNDDVPPPLVLNEDTYWVVDPIDGTINFLARSPLWSTLVALIHGGRPVLGLVLLPALDEVFIASEGGGARYGKLSRGPASFRPCAPRRASSLADAHVSCSSPRTFLHRGVDGFAQALTAASAEMRTHSDAYGYTRILNGGIDAMLDPIVAPYDVAALQVLFDETPGAVFTTLHGHVGPSRHRMGTALAATSRDLADEILALYRSWLRHGDARLPAAATASPEGFAQAHALASSRSPFSFEGAGAATAAWTLGLEMGVAAFREEHPDATVEDVSVLVSCEESISASVKNGTLSTAPQVDAALGVHVRAVVSGGSALRVASLPLEEQPESLVLHALRDALAQSRERGLEPGTEILAWRDPLVGHFGPSPWELGLDFEAFGAVLALVKEQREEPAAGIQTISAHVQVSSHKRLQVFLDGAQQTLSGVTFLVSASAVSRRGDEKRRASMRLFDNGVPELESFKARFLAELTHVKERALALLDAPLVPEDVEYAHLAVDADLLGLILHEALGHAAEGDLVELGSSGFGAPRTDGSSDPRRVRQDLEVAPPWMDIVIDGALDTCGLLPIDCEGTAPLRKKIVREGRLVDGLHTRQTARTAGAAPDGCARQESVFHPSLNRMTSIWVQARDLRPLPLVADGERIDRPTAESVRRVLEADGFLRDDAPVLYLSGWKGGTATCSNLEFRADVAFVHELRKGQPPLLLREANFTGIATDCFLSAVAAYGPVLCRTIGTCGKDSQGVPTSDGGPAILVLARHPRVSVIGAGEAEA